MNEEQVRKLKLKGLTRQLTTAEYLALDIQLRIETLDTLKRIEKKLENLKHA